MKTRDGAARVQAQTYLLVEANWSRIEGPDWDVRVVSIDYCLLRIKLHGCMYVVLTITRTMRERLASELTTLAEALRAVARAQGDVARMDAARC